MSGPESVGGAPQRTDPRSFAVKALAMLTQLVVPLGFAGYTILDDGDLGDLIVYFLPIVLAAIGANFFFAWLGWRRFTYQVNPADIRVESGIVSRQARSVPYERIQDVSIEQKLVPRLFGLVQVKFETGAGGKDELTLAYLTEAEGERLRELVRARRDGESLSTKDAVVERAEQDELLFTMGPRRVVTFGLFEFSLVVVAGFAGFAQQFDFLLPFDLWDFEEWQARLAGPGQWLAGLGFAAQIAGGAIAALILLAVGFGTGLIRTVLREWDFRLERTDKGLRRRRGLLTRTDVVMPVHRVQALRVGTGLVRRFFGWHKLSVVSLAQDSGNASHDAAPFAQMEEIAPIVATTGFALPPVETDWKRGDSRYRIDRVIAAGLILAVMAIGLSLSPRSEVALVPMIGMIAVGLVELYNWRFAANACDARQIYVRRSWLSPKTSIANRVKLQSVEIAQGPLARRRGYAHLHLGLAGGNFRIHGIPLERARELRGAVLASIARTDFSELV
ncbi:PH domain-containing protein [Qipengyuania sp. MTN3-11]|uniref:PH domain-containing protein n=1 Tax=Qipengyuania sp. MTN3-11 TaxID=3056557 RepID=UPI0036F255B4